MYCTKDQIITTIKDELVALDLRPSSNSQHNKCLAKKKQDTKQDTNKILNHVHLFFMPYTHKESISPNTSVHFTLPIFPSHKKPLTSFL